MSLSTLPAELKMYVLENIDDYPTLRSIVHVSSQFYQIYLSRRQKLLSQVTIRHLDSLGTIVLALSGLANTEEHTSDRQYAVYLERIHLVEPATVVHYMKESKFHQPMLDIEHSLALLRYASIIPWKRTIHFGNSDLTHNRNPALAALFKSRLEEGRKLKEFLFIGGYPDGSMKDKLFRTRWRGKYILEWEFTETSVRTLHYDDRKDLIEMIGKFGYLLSDDLGF